MIFDAIVLAGGRSSRLDGIDKTTLEVAGRTLLDRAVTASEGARHVVVVGSAPSDERYAVVHEEPAFGGPAAAVAAGVAALAQAVSSIDGPPGSDYTLVLAGDLPFVRPAVEALIAAAHSLSRDADGVIAADENGRRQYLTALYRTDALRSRCAESDLVGASMRKFVDTLGLVDVPVPAGSTHDVDTWTDAEQIGATRKALG